MKLARDVGPIVLGPEPAQGALAVMGHVRMHTHVAAVTHLVDARHLVPDAALGDALDLEAGGDVAHNLHALYSYVISRLTLANLRNDVSILEEADRLIRPIREAWVEIGPQVARGARA